ncbi:GTP cyclohydrolase II [Noviherbaspirillum cavernae]|uniref:GTP cyclohydrolase-2 n=1 Tax=Noviherbaspirillum cavernae TaxID=2320862 RepID=A0A418X0S2_9BURK|nr:GTP cyclohydrolase II [Noviherbaspirillum cavernae]RJG06086.1 GTP cyclohydrolase II [Noviherbaspirillum cavernae]
MSESKAEVPARAGGELIEYVASSLLPTRHGDFRIHVYRAVGETVEHTVLVKGDLNGRENVLVRVHSECLTGDVFGSMRCDCGEQLDAAMAMINEAGAGAIVYLRGHEGRGIGLANKIRAYQLQDQGRDTVEANVDLGLPVDTRDYQAAAQILHHMGVTSICLITNNPAKMAKLEESGLRVAERIPVLIERTPHNTAYLRTKQEKLGHMLDFE